MQGDFFPLGRANSARHSVKQRGRWAKGHDRLETRELTHTIGLNDHLNWPSVDGVCRMVRTRQVGDARRQETAYFVTSLKSSQGDAELVLNVSRGHWSAI